MCTSYQQEVVLTSSRSLDCPFLQQKMLLYKNKNIGNLDCRDTGNYFAKNSPNLQMKQKFAGLGEIFGGVGGNFRRYLIKYYKNRPACSSIASTLTAWISKNQKRKTNSLLIILCVADDSYLPLVQAVISLCSWAGQGKLGKWVVEWGSHPSTAGLVILGIHWVSLHRTFSYLLDSFLYTG